MGRWLKKTGKAFQKLANKFDDAVIDNIQEELQEQLDKIDNVGDSMKAVVAKGKECAALSRETVEVCKATETKREEMIAFASEIQATFNSMAIRGGDSSILETIKNLTDGSKVRQAMDLAVSLEESAMSCVTKSVQMLNLMEEGMDALPDVIQKQVQKIADDAADDSDDDDDNNNNEDNNNRDRSVVTRSINSRGVDNDQESTDIDDERLLVKDLEQDYKDVETVVNKLQNDFNLVTALKVGLDAFTQLADKGKRSKALFVSVERFAADISEITQAFREMDVTTIISKCKDILKCIGLLEIMREVATGAGKLLKLLVSLFQATADRISTLWKSLAFAKDCMLDGMDLVKLAKEMCQQAKEKSTALITKSRDIYNKLEDIGDFDRQSIPAMRELSKNGEIQETIDLATSMDDIILECSTKVSTMVQKVTTGFKEIPPILTQGIDMESLGRQEGDPEPMDVEQDVRELDESRQAIVDADFLSLIKAGKRSFESVSIKGSTCKDILNFVDDFAANCSATIDSFMSVWDLEAATKKVQEMCRLVKLGELMQQFAEQVKKLLLAILALLKEAFQKFSSGISDDVVDGLGGAVEAGLNFVNTNLHGKFSFFK